MTTAGWEQARALADSLSAQGLSAITCSPRLRTRQTAEVVAEKVGLQSTVATALDEVDFGDWTGRRFDELDGQPDWDHWNASRSTARPPSGESMGEALKRALHGLRQLDRRHSGERVLVVTHCDIIRALLCWRDGRSLDDILSFEARPAEPIAFSLALESQAAA